MLSLASLREHEKRHAQQQADAVRARAEAEQRARAEAERESLRAADERRQAEQAAREYAASSQRAGQARLEAARDAEVERAEALARNCQQLKAELSVEREARRAAELASTSSVLRQRLLMTATAAVCLGSWLAGAGLYFGALRPGSERALLAADQSLQAERRARSEAEASGARASRGRDELTLRVGALEESLRAARTVPSAADVSPRPPRVGGTIQPPPPHRSNDICRDDGDPLNPCLKR